jgi:hypothetical protein
VSDEDPDFTDVDEPGRVAAGSWSDWWALAANVATTLGLIGAVWAGYFVYTEYRDRREMTLAAQTIDLIDAWEERGYRAAYAKLRDATRGFFDALPAADRPTATTDANARQNLEARFYRGFFADAANVTAFEQVRYFFNRLDLCLQSNLCSTEIAKTFFDDTIGTFLDCFGGYLAAEAAVAGREEQLAMFRQRFSLPSKACLERNAP